MPRKDWWTGLKNRRSSKQGHRKTFERRRKTKLAASPLPHLSTTVSAYSSNMCNEPRRFGRFGTKKAWSIMQSPDHRGRCKSTGKGVATGRTRLHLRRARSRLLPVRRRKGRQGRPVPKSRRRRRTKKREREGFGAGTGGKGEWGSSLIKQEASEDLYNATWSRISFPFLPGSFPLVSFPSLIVKTFEGRGLSFRGWKFLRHEIGALGIWNFWCVGFLLLSFPQRFFFFSSSHLFYFWFFPALFLQKKQKAEFEF